MALRPLTGCINQYITINSEMIYKCIHIHIYTYIHNISRF